MLRRRLKNSVNWQCIVRSGRPWCQATVTQRGNSLVPGIQRNLRGSKISISSSRFVFFCRSEKQDGRHDLWLAETFSTSDLKLLNVIKGNLTGSKISTYSTKFVFFDRSGKQDVRPGLWLAEAFDFSSERNSKTFDMKQDIKIFHQVCIFRDEHKKKMAAPASDWPRHFDFCETDERNSAKLDRKQDVNDLYLVCVFQADE